MGDFQRQGQSGPEAGEDLVSRKLGGISGKPYREKEAENFLKGKTLSNALTAQAQQLALANAAPLKYNAEKIDMAKGLLASGIDKLSA